MEQFIVDIKRRNFDTDRLNMITLTKQPGETLTFSMNFLYALADGDSIASVSGVTVSPSGPTISAPSLQIVDPTTQPVTYTAAPVIQFTVAGGTDGTLYKLVATVVTTLGETLEGTGFLNVKTL